MQYKTAATTPKLKATPTEAKIAIRAVWLLFSLFSNLWIYFSYLLSAMFIFYMAFTL